ncbi:site-specific DNA-methyltransferase, partial [Streptococcus suis]
KNEKTNPRYHSDWLNMMYPRLVLARNLLKDSGVIFISIDDNEQANLNAICDEIFGEENFVADVIWERAFAPVNLKKHFSESHDYILVYAKNVEFAVNHGIPRSEDSNSRYQNPDNDVRG